jgi:molybdate transport system ATP-binding protein
MSSAPIIRAAFKGKLGQFSLDAELAVPARGVTGLFGPSGCGKTTLLRCIAGLSRVADGFCSIGGEVWQDGAAFRPPHQRPIGYVFQEPSLFAHLSVRNNLRYGMPRRPTRSRDEAHASEVGWDDVVALLGLGALLDRTPRHLSGGERQRVAIGRALLSQPRLLLLDEPLSALDQRAKGEILPFVERLHRALSIPVLYVSHDMAELERFADHLVLMEAGRVIGSGALRALECDPSLPLLRARDAAVSLEGVVEGYDAADGLLSLRVDGARFLVPSEPAAPGERRRLRVAAENVSLALERPRGSSILNVLPARILSVAGVGTHEITLVLELGPSPLEERVGDTLEPLGPLASLEPTADEERKAEGATQEPPRARLISRVTRRSWEQLGLVEGQRIFAQVKSVALAPLATR